MFGGGRRRREREARVRAAAWALVQRHGVSGAFVELDRRAAGRSGEGPDLPVAELWAEVKRQAGMSGADTATRMLYRG